MFGLGSFGRWVARTEPTTDPVAGMNLLVSDVDELAEIARTVAGEYGVSSPAVISANLSRLLGRQVPVSSLTSSGALGFADLNFADGTVLLVHSRHTGELGMLAVRALQHRVRLDGYTCTADGVVLRLASVDRLVDLAAVGVAPGL